MNLTTERLLLRPVRHSDAADIERVIFEDPEVVKGLAHDGTDPGVRRFHAQNWRGFGPDGTQSLLDEYDAAVADRELARELGPVAVEALQRGRETPGLAMLRYHAG